MGKRPRGVTLIAAGLLLVGGVGLVFAATTLTHPPQAQVRPCVGVLCGFDWRPLVFALAGIQAVLAVWALVTGVGLLGRFEWARRSAMASLPLLLLFFAAGHGFGLFVGLGLMSPLFWYFGKPEIKAWFAQAAG